MFGSVLNCYWAPKMEAKVATRCAGRGPRLTLALMIQSTKVFKAMMRYRSIHSSEGSTGGRIENQVRLECEFAQMGSSDSISGCEVNRSRSVQHY